MSDDFTLYVDLQQIVSSDSIPGREKIESWVRQTLLFIEKEAKAQLNNAQLENTLSSQQQQEYELTIRIVDKDEIQSLNRSYRHKDKPTNVLSFPFEPPLAIPLEMQPPLLGDLIICHELVLEEAEQQQKTIEAHWAHIVIHGVLHLKGYDHIEDSDAQIMEALEVKILKKLNISDPYQ